MIERNFDIYVDVEFLSNFFQAMNDCDTLSEDFEVYYSFWKIIKQDHIQVISLESGKTLKPDDIVRVFQSNFRLFDNQNWPFKYTIPETQNPQSIFLGEQFDNGGNTLCQTRGFLFCGIKGFLSQWGKLLLINRPSTIHVKKGFSWDGGLTPYNLPVNSIMVVDPYLSTWREYDKNAKKRPPVPSSWVSTPHKIKDNLVEAIETLASNHLECVSLKVVTKMRTKGRKRDGAYCDEDSKEIIGSFKSQISIYVELVDASSMEAKNNMNDLMHDRYIITNYHLFISTHSLDYINRDEKGLRTVRKNTQLIVQPLIKADYFDFYKSKLQDYSRIFNGNSKWRRGQFVDRHFM